MEICKMRTEGLIVNKFICFSVNMGIEVQIGISMGYIAIWENLTQKWVLSQTWP